MQTEELRLDGNAAAGTLSEVFDADVTSALATCAGCGSARPMGALLEYGNGMGVILRCPGCNTAMLRMVRTRGYVRLDASGISLLVIPRGD
jgi:DNA-directed RNA polymerase subunit RPC12/RpoP